MVNRARRSRIDSFELPKPQKEAPVAQKIRVGAGFAIVLLALSLTNWGGLPWQTLLGIEFPQILVVKTSPQILLTAVTCLVLGHRWSTHPPTARAMVLWQSASCLVTAVCLGALLALRGLLDVSQALISLGVAALLGAASGCLFMLWGRLAMEQRDRGSCLEVALISLGIEAVLYAVAYSLGETGRVLFLIGCTLVSLPLFMAVLRHRNGRPSVETTTWARSPAVADAPASAAGETTAKLRGPLVCIAASVFAFAFIRTSALLDITDRNLVNQLGALFGALFAGILWLGWLRWLRAQADERSVDPMRLYQLAFPVIATLAVCMPVLNRTLLLVTAAVLHALFFLIIAFLPVAATAQVRDTAHQASAGVLGLFGASAFGSVALSTGIAYLIYREGAVSTGTLLLCALVIIYVLAMAYVTLQRYNRRFSDPPAVPFDSRASLTEDCTRMTERYGLTQRESDVLPLLVKGFSLHGIAEHLGVSDNTVRTHMRNLYKKLGVHSRQDVLELLEGPADVSHQ